MQRAEGTAMGYTTEIISVLVGALAMLGAAVLTYLGVIRKSSSNTGEQMLQQGVDLHKLALQQANLIRDELKQDIANAENARREMAEERDKYSKKVDSLTEELELCRRDRRKLVEILERHLGPETLEGIPDMPEFDDD